jgi:predicted permease
VATALALFRRFTGLMPRRYRARHRDEALGLMESLLMDAHRERGPAGVARVTVTAIVDLVARLPAAYLAQADTLRRDVHHAVRALRRRPLSTTAAIATLAIGIGLNAAIFSVFDWVVLRPLPYPAPHELVRVFTAGTAPVTAPAAVTHSEFLALARATTLRASTAFSTATRSIAGRGFEPAHVVVARVAGDLFGTLGARPTMGRGIESREAANGTAVVVLADSLWRTHFAADPGIVGRVIAIDRRPHTVVGVMPAGRGYPADAELWRPLTPDEREDDDRELQMLGRLANGVTAEHASIELTTLANAASAGARRAWVEDVQRTTVRDVRAALTALLLSSALVLVMASANVAALVAARNADRASEMALRGALGASRAGLLRQLLTESVLLAAAGGAVGLLLGAWSLHILVAVAPAGIPRLAEVALDGRVVAIGIAITFLAGLGVGLVPAYHAARVDLRTSLAGAESARVPGRRRGRRLLVAGQMAMAVLLTVGAGLLARSLHHLLTLDNGFSADRLLAVDLYLRDAGGDVRALYRDLIANAEALPGVRSAAISVRLPHELAGLRVSIRGDDLPATAASAAVLRPVTPRYFETAGIPLLQGRAFSAADTRTATRVAIVNAAFARDVLGGVEPVGRRLTTDILNGPVTVVGVVSNVTPGGAPDRAALYVPLEQVMVPGGSLLVRTVDDPLQVVAALSMRLREVAPSLPRDRIHRVADALERARAIVRFNTRLAAAFAGLALMLAAIGVYGLTAGEVAMQWRELAIRMALGATRRELLWTVMRPSALVLAAGTTAGIAIALGTGRWMTALLHGITAADPSTLVAVPLFLGAVSLIASLLAAARVLRANVATTLRLD